MTLKDWIDDSIERFQTQPPLQATHESANKFRMGAQKRLSPRIGNSIWEMEGWDVVLVLDACRYDLWCEVATEYPQIEAPENSIISNASCSIDWINRTFNGHPEKAKCTGYITGNPFANNDAPDTKSADLTDDDLGYFAPLYRTEWGPIDGSEVETIPPEPLTDHAIEAWRRRDELGIDRLVVHYMQPHQPYRSRPDWENIGKNLKNLVNNREMAGACAWQRARKGKIGTDELWEAYRDNLEWVLDDVTDRLLGNVGGTVVFTADHGNAMGEWGEWAHPPGALSPAVRRVPWVPVESLDEKTVTPDCESRISQAEPPASEGEDPDATSVDEQLAALGYK